jgi:hypothetical protein
MPLVSLQQLLHVKHDCYHQRLTEVVCSSSDCSTHLAALVLLTSMPWAQPGYPYTCSCSAQAASHALQLHAVVLYDGLLGKRATWPHSPASNNTLRRCHVMEHESFESAETAAIMNKHFINIKVDREERPDVDRVYVSLCCMDSLDLQVSCCTVDAIELDNIIAHARARAAGFERAARCSVCTHMYRKGSCAQRPQPLHELNEPHVVLHAPGRHAQSMRACLRTCSGRKAPAPHSAKAQQLYHPCKPVWCTRTDMMGLLPSQCVDFCVLFVCKHCLCFCCCGGQVARWMMVGWLPAHAAVAADDICPGNNRWRWLAYVRVAHTRPEAILWRHVLPRYVH